jgi:hypothetical protein
LKNKNVSVVIDKNSVFMHFDNDDNTVSERRIAAWSLYHKDSKKGRPSFSLRYKDLTTINGEKCMYFNWLAMRMLNNMEITNVGDRRIIISYLGSTKLVELDKILCSGHMYYTNSQFGDAWLPLSSLGFNIK